MSAWDRDTPGAGDAAALRDLATRLDAHGSTLTEVSILVRAQVADLTAAWTGQAATARAERTERVADQVGAAVPVIAPVVAALHAYADEIEQSTTSARTVLDARDTVRVQHTIAQAAAVDAAFGDPTGAHHALATLRDVGSRLVDAERALSDLSDRRRAADTTLVAVLQAGTPQAWTDGGARVAALDPLQLARGTDPRALATWAASLPDTPEGDAALRWRVQDLSPQSLEALLATHPHLASRLMRPDPEALAALHPDLAAAIALEDSAERLAAVAAAFEQMSAVDRAALAQVHPWAVNNLDGAPLDVRAAANRTAIRAAIPDAERWIRELDARIAELDELSTHSPDRWKDELLLRQQERQALVDRIPWCEGLLAEPVGQVDYEARPSWHQVVLFDPDAGRFAEVIGSLDAANMAVLVGGTGTNLGSMDDQATRAWDLVAEGDGDLAVITYLGGPMPQNPVLNSPWPHFAQRVAPHLAGFANGVRAVTDVPVTVAGHSYGGLVVGRAEASGMVVDRVLYIAASGSGVRSVDEYAAPGTPRYSMTAPGDLIEGVQAGEFHGRDPDEVAGTVRIETGRRYDEETGQPDGLLRGQASHSDVFDTNTDAFRNIRAVMTGGQVQLWTPPVDTWADTPHGRPAYTGREFPMEDPHLKPPTQDVP